MSEDNRSTAGSRPARRTPAKGRISRTGNAENLRRSGGTVQNTAGTAQNSRGRAQNSGDTAQKSSRRAQNSGDTAQNSGRRVTEQDSPNAISGRSSRKTKGYRRKRPEIPPVSLERNSNIIDGITFGFSIALLLGSAVGCVYSGAGETLIEDFIRILTMPAPLVTDYFALGSLPAAFLNAGLCGLSMALFMYFMPGLSHVNTLAGFFLVISHCFYGLNFLNMWPCFLAPFLYLKLKNLNYNDNLHVCMFATCFAPFVSEFLFRYIQGEMYRTGTITITLRGCLLTVVFMFILAFVAPAILPGVNAWHKGYNLYNGGLDYGMFGFLLFSFLYRTMGVVYPRVPIRHNHLYNLAGNSYRLFGNIFFLLLFLSCLGAGWFLNGRSFKGIEIFFRDTGYHSDFAKRYGMRLCLINIGLYGLFFLVYINIVIHFTEGAGFTAPTFGVILAALTFTSMGQHARNVWPIFIGYPLLSLFATLFNHLIGGNATWTVSTQAYINSVAFATGLCPIVGRFGSIAGIVAGMLCAALCTATSSLHGGLVLYNGGFTAGITALILIPILEHYIPNPRNDMDHHIDLRDMITLRGPTTQPPNEKDPE